MVLSFLFPYVCYRLFTCLCFLFFLLMLLCLIRYLFYSFFLSVSYLPISVLSPWPLSASVSLFFSLFLLFSLFSSLSLALLLFLLSSEINLDVIFAKTRCPLWTNILLVWSILTSERLQVFTSFFAGVYSLLLATTVTNQNSFHEKLKADWSQGMLAIIPCRIFCLPVYYPKM